MNLLSVIKKPFQNQSHKSPYNRDLNRPTQAIIYDIQSKGQGKKSIKRVQTSAGTIVFEDGVAVLPDDSRADDIHAELQAKHALHPSHNQYGVVRHREGLKRDGIHRYKFGNWPGVPYKEYDELGRVKP